MENPIGIIGAMDVEVELLKESMAAEGAVETAHTGQLSFFTGTLSGVPVVVAQCDVGMVNAAAHTQLLIDRFSVRGVVNTGVAGSLDASIDIGDIVVATDAVRKPRLRPRANTGAVHTRLLRRRGAPTRSGGRRSRARHPNLGRPRGLGRCLRARGR